MMAKKALLAAAAIFLISLSLISASFAVDDLSILMVTGNGETTPQPSATYSWTQAPWLYMQLPSTVFSYTITWWNLSGTPNYSSVLTTNDQGNTETWNTLADWFNAGGSRQAGEWNIRALYSSGGEDIVKTTTFNVTPEPISSALFLIGGVGLAAWQIHRKKKNKS